jgi:hypothetical protein
MKNSIPLKYACLDKFDIVYNNCDQEEVRQLLSDLRSLIYYQMNEIKNQRMEIISVKHKDAWKQYDNQ